MGIKVNEKTKINSISGQKNSKALIVGYRNIIRDNIPHIMQVAQDIWNTESLSPYSSSNNVIK